MQRAAPDSTYEFYERYYSAILAEIAKIVKKLTPGQCHDLLEISDLPFFASAAYKAVHTLLRRPNRDWEPTRAEVIRTREIYHALKQRADTMLGNKIFNKTKRVMLDHMHPIGTRFFATPQDFMHSRLKDKLCELGPQLDFGLCFALAASSVMAIMLGDLQTFDARLIRIDDSSMWRMSKLKSFMHKQKTFSKLNESEQEDAIFFQNMILFQRLYSFKHLLPETTRVGHQNFFATAKLVAPNKLPDMALCGMFTWMYDRRSLAQLFDQLENAFFSDPIKAPIAVLVMSSAHIICVSFDYAENAWRMVNAAPSFLVRKEFLADRILKTFSMQELNHIALSIQLVTLEAAAKEYYPSLEQFHAWHDGYIHNTMELSKTKDSLGATVLQVAARSGDVFTITGLIEKKVDVNDASYLPALECAVLANHTMIAEALIGAGANINFQYDESSLSIFARAILLGNMEMINLLVRERGLDRAIVHRFTEHSFEHLCESHQVTAEKREAFLLRHRRGSRVVFTADDLFELVDLRKPEKLQVSISNATRSVGI